MLQRFKNFSENLLLERINESVIYFSPKFRNLLSKIDNEISNDLMEVEVTDIKPDVTFVDLDPEKDDYLTFTTMKNAMKVIDDEYTHIKDIENVPDGTGSWPDKYSRISLVNAIYDNPKLSDMFKKSRNPIRIGKFINRVLGNKYEPKKVEEFVNMLKAKKEQTKESFRIVEGEEIAYWYKQKNYAEVSGSLGNSCMRSKSDYVFEIYVKNPEVCKMLILVQDEKLLGRALIWKVDDNPKEGDFQYFMDRQYTIKDSDIQKFRYYADENNWAWKTNNNHSSTRSVTYKGEVFNYDFDINLNKIKYSYFPYMDTFKRYDPENHILYNDDYEDREQQGHYILDDTDGGYREVERGVWSEWHDTMIDEEYAVWSDWAQSYLDSERATRVDSGSGRYHDWYPEDCEDIFFDEETEEYYHIQDSVYSDAYGRYIYDDIAVQVIDDIDTSDGDPYNADSNWYYKNDDDIINLSYVRDMSWFRVLSERFYTWDNYSYAHKDLFTKDYNDDYILSAFTIKVYKVEEESDIKFLTKIDAEALGIKIGEKEFIMDKFEYYEGLEDVLQKLYKSLNNMRDYIQAQVNGEGQLRLKFENDEDYKNKLSRKLINITNSIDDIEDGIFIDLNKED